MRLSIKTQYGLQALFELAQENAELNIGEIAKRQRIPVRFLEQILLILKRRGLVASSRGKQGGYSLAKGADEINLREVVESLEGDIELAPKTLSKKSPEIYGYLKETEQALCHGLAKVTLADLVFRKKQKDRLIIYEI